MTNHFLGAGFRPFFFGAAWLGALWILLWLGQLHAGLPVPARIPPLTWHTHEMLFGYVMAVLAGFLLTAMQNWTGLRRVTPGQLAVLFGLWLAGRLALLVPDSLPLWLVSGIDLAFLPLLALVVSRTLVAAGNRRNYSFIPMLLAFWVLNLCLHLEWHGVVEAVSVPVQDLTVLLVATLLVFMGGRVIPFFTGRRLPEADPRQWPWLNWAATLACLALIPAYLLLGRGPALAGPLLFAALLVAARLLAWHPWRTAREPMLWILHLGYAWVPAGLGLLALSAYGVPWTAGVHALMVGAMGSLTLGMMARVALGHSGRPIAARPAVTCAFVLMSLAAITRVLAGLHTGGAGVLLSTASLLWSVALLLYAVVYTPILLRAGGQHGSHA